MKTCRICKQTKPESEFHKDKKARDGLCRECKVCRTAIVTSRNNITITGNCVICGKEVTHHRKYCAECKINKRQN